MARRSTPIFQRYVATVLACVPAPPAPPAPLLDSLKLVGPAACLPACPPSLQFMADAPWYLNSSQPSLKHQRNWKDQVTDELKWYDRGAKVFQATKYRKGACEK